jgi:polyhydroxyalkanoate synthase
MLERGLDVYLIEWGEPDGRLALSDYAERYLDAHVDAVRRASGHAAINLLGICQGGVFSLCYTALYPEKVCRLVTTVTPVDFHTPRDALSRLVRHVEPGLIDGARGVIPGAALNALFLMLKPYRLTQLKYLDMLEHLDDADAMRLFLKMERWIFDSPALAVPALREFVSMFYQGNGFVTDRVEIGGRAVNLRALETPILNVYAKDDHLVPPEASRALRALVPDAAYSEYELPGGHIGMYVGKSSAARVAETVANWLSRR